MDLLEPDEQSLAGRLIKQFLPEKQQKKLIAFSQEIASLESVLRESESNLESATNDVKNELRKQRDSARNQFNDFINVNRSGLDGLSIEKTVQTALARLSKDPDLASRHQNEFEQFIKSVELDKQNTILETRDQLVDYGVAKLNDVSSRKLSFDQSYEEYSSDKLTAFAHNQVTRFNSVLLNELVFGGTVSFEFNINYVDPHLSLRKQWRDVYRYGKDNHLLGWTRFESGRETKFNRDGLIILEQDQLGRCLRCRIVSYEFADGKGTGNRRYPVWTPVRHVPGNQVWTYQYADDNDFRGRVVKRDNLGE